MAVVTAVRRLLQHERVRFCLPRCGRLRGVIRTLRGGGGGGGRLVDVHQFVLLAEAVQGGRAPVPPTLLANLIGYSES